MDVKIIRFSENRYPADIDGRPGFFMETFCGVPSGNFAPYNENLKQNKFTYY